MLSMLRHLLVFVCIVFATAALIGCGGKEDARRKGTTDTRIVGQWRARQITFNGMTQPCPGEIQEGVDTVNCSGDAIQFRDDGTYTIGTTTDDYYFDGTGLTMYNRAGNNATFGVTFDGATNEMTWSWNQNGRPATMIADRVLLE
jgi:hypothetical protein